MHHPSKHTPQARQANALKEIAVELKRWNDREDRIIAEVEAMRKNEMFGEIK